MIFGSLVFVHVCVSAALISIVLLQSGRGGGLAGLGGGGAQAVFGGRGATDILAKITQGLAIAFMVLSLLLALYGGMSTDDAASIIEQRRSQLAIPATQALQDYQAEQAVALDPSTVEPIAEETTALQPPAEDPAPAPEQ